jgi:hexosaminidase
MQQYLSIPFFPTRRACFDGTKLVISEADLDCSVGFTGLPADGFRITAKETGVCIEGNTAAALNYAIATIRQVCASDPDGAFPCGVFEDFADFPVRGYMLDISRCKVPTMQHLRRLVDALSSLRYNQLQLYMEHTFAYPQHPLVWAEASPMTAAEVRELEAYCKTRHIELVPNQNSFGHMERWLRYPAYHHLAECPNGYIHPIAGPREYGSVLYPGAQSKKFLQGLYDALLPNFSSQRFHVGCDEPWELGQGRSRQAVAKNGKHNVYIDFLHKINDLVSERGRIMHYWADILLECPQLIAAAPKEGVPIIWGYDVNHPFAGQCALLAANGMEFQVAPGDATWKCFSGRLQTTLKNQRLAAIEGKRYGAHGYLLTHWGDLGHHQTWPTTLPGLVMGGQFAWNADSAAEHGLEAIINQLFFKEESPVMAKVLIDLGELDAKLPSIRVGSWFYEALMREVDTPLPTAAIAALLEELDAIEKRLRTAQPNVSDSDCLRGEIRLGIEMTRMAVIRNGGHGDVSAWEQLRPNLINEFKNVWLQRNRSGGLGESLAYW